MKGGPDNILTPKVELFQFIPYRFNFIPHVNQDKFTWGCCCSKTFHVREFVSTHSDPDPSLVKPDCFRVGAIYSLIGFNGVKIGILVYYYFI